MTLHAKIFIALLAGLAVAAAARALGLTGILDAFIVMEPAGTIFIRLITMVVVPLVIASLFVSVASLGAGHAFGRIGGSTLFYMVVTTFLAAVIGTGVALVTRVGAGGELPSREAVGRNVTGTVEHVDVPASWGQTLVNIVPQNPVASAAQGDLLPLMVAICLFGAAATRIRAESRATLLAFFSGVNELAMVVIGWVMRLSPVAVFLLIGATVARSGVTVLQDLAAYVLVVILALVIHASVVLIPILKFGAGMNVASFFRSVSEALVLAFSTASSTATLPVSMANARQMGVPETVTSFVLPAGSTLNKNGAAVYKAVTAVFLMRLAGVALGPGAIATVVLASTLAAFAGAGIPGSSLVTTMIVLNAVGLGAEGLAGIAFVAGVDRPLDMCRTAVNTLGNLVGAVWVARRVRSAETEGEAGLKTISEKIFSAKSGRDVGAGDIVVADVDWVIGTDASAPMAIAYFDKMGGVRLAHPERVVFALDHYAPPTAKTAGYHEQVRAFAGRHGARLFEMGEGISHQLMVEQGRLRPGQLAIGADSHTVTCGALNLFAAGVGSSELAAAMMTGQMWWRVPETIRFVLDGERPPDVSAKDIALAMVGHLGAEGANYQAVEFDGPALAALSLEDRLVISNMSVEMGAKAAIFPFDRQTELYLAARRSSASEPVTADSGARYVREIVMALGHLSPRVARPYAPDDVVPLVDVAGTPVQMVFIGTCTGGRVPDFHEALAVLDRAGGRLAPGVQLVLTPASAEVQARLITDGTLARFQAMGAVLTTPGCGACCGTSGVIPGDGATVISTANRNFKSRMGSAAKIYLASAAACAAAAASGVITLPGPVTSDPREGR